MGILKDALESGSLLGNVWGGKYDKAITKASADPMDKAKLRALQKKGNKKIDEDATINARKRRVEADEEEVAPKKKKKAAVEDDAAFNKRKRRVEAEEEPAPTKKKKKKKVSGDECDDPSLSVKEKRRCQLKNK